MSCVDIIPPARPVRNIVVGCDITVDGKSDVAMFDNFGRGFFPLIFPSIYFDRRLLYLFALVKESNVASVDPSVS